MIYDQHVMRLRRLIGEVKAAAVVQMLADELDSSKEKVVVFANHRNVLATLALGLSRFGVAYVDGDSTPAQRDRAIDGFQTNPFTRVFLGQTLACQTGITLTAASRVVLAEPDWTGVVNVQAAGRVARIGQTSKRCIAQMISLAGTLDEAIVANHRREVDRIAAVLK